MPSNESTIQCDISYEGYTFQEVPVRGCGAAWCVCMNVRNGQDFQCVCVYGGL
jgi:hypothetical protein